MLRYFSKAIDEKNELAHFGILGMKWGIRRFQNKDGTRTEAGKERYGGGKYKAPDGPYFEKKPFSDQMQKTKAAKEFDKQVNKAYEEYLKEIGMNGVEVRKKSYSDYMQAYDAWYNCNFDDKSLEKWYIDRYKEICEDNDRKLYDGDEEAVGKLFGKMTPEQEKYFKESAFTDAYEKNVWSKVDTTDEKYHIGENAYFKYEHDDNPDYNDYLIAYKPITQRGKDKVLEEEGAVINEMKDYQEMKFIEKMDKELGRGKWVNLPYEEFEKAKGNSLMELFKNDEKQKEYDRILAEDFGSGDTYSMYYRDLK